MFAAAPLQLISVFEDDNVRQLSKSSINHRLQFVVCWVEHLRAIKSAK